MLLPDSRSTVVNAEHDAKALDPMLVTVAGIVMDVMPVSLNALVPILASVLLPDANSTVVNAEHDAKELSPIDFTIVPISTLVSFDDFVES